MKKEQKYFLSLQEIKKRITKKCVDFLVGNIAPDCSVLYEDGSEYIPDKNITHWKLDGDNQYEDFKNKYLKKENPRLL